MPPLKIKNVKALRSGTVRLSNPKGERLSVKAATKATPNAAKIAFKSGNGYNTEKTAS